MRAGQLRDRVRFEDRDVPSGAYVSGAADFSTIEEAWARIDQLGTRFADEEEIGDGLRDVRAFEITVRYTPALAALTSEARVIDLRTNDVYNIRLVRDPDRRREKLVFTVDIGRPGES